MGLANNGHSASTKHNAGRTTGLSGSKLSPGGDRAPRAKATGDERSVSSVQLDEHAVGLPEDGVHPRVRLHGGGSQHVADLDGVRRALGAVTGDISDDEGDAAVVETERVVTSRRRREIG